MVTVNINIQKNISKSNKYHASLSNLLGSFASITWILKEAPVELLMHLLLSYICLHFRNVAVMSEIPCSHIVACRPQSIEISLNRPFASYVVVATSLTEHACLPEFYNVWRWQS